MRSAILTISLLALAGCANRSDKPFYLRLSDIPSRAVVQEMAVARAIVTGVEGHPGTLPPALWIYDGYQGEEYGITRLLYGEGGRFLGAEIQLRDRRALVHELVHVLRRSNDHDRRYNGKVWQWHD